MKQMQFKRTIKPSVARRLTRFPDDTSVGVSLKLKSEKNNRYQIRLAFSEAVAKKVGLHCQGMVTATISECGNGIQVKFNPKPPADFEGFAVKPTGTWTKAQDIKKLGLTSVECQTLLNFPGEMLDHKRIKTFNTQYVQVLDMKKHHLIIDISELPIFLKPEK